MSSSVNFAIIALSKCTINLFMFAVYFLRCHSDWYRE